jgi:hypothetical protein
MYLYNYKIRTQTKLLLSNKDTQKTQAKNMFWHEFLAPKMIFDIDTHLQVFLAHLLTNYNQSLHENNIK